MPPGNAQLLIVGLLVIAVSAPSGLLTPGVTALSAHGASAAAGAAASSEAAATPSQAAAAPATNALPEVPSPSGDLSGSLPSTANACAGAMPSGGLRTATAFASAHGASPPIIAGGDPPLNASEAIAPAVAPVLATAIAAGACPQTIFPPRAPATPGERERVDESGVVEPLYQESPAPMGLADYGLTSEANGTLVASVLSTTSLLGVVDANSTGILPLDLYNEEFGPDAFSLQLNAVLTNVTLFGVPGYEFWTQNVIEYYPSAHVLDLITNVWNFSGNFEFGPAIYAHGPNGTLYADEVYEAVVDRTHISYPFNLSMYLNSTLASGRDEVSFTDVLTGGNEGFVAPFDYLVFNSTRRGGPPLTVPAEFSANGTGYDPLGLTNDFELDVGGPGDGSQATLVAADARLALAYWDPTAQAGHGGYLSVPSAFSFGGETGETSTGATVTWSDAPGGPAGASTYGVMATGPSFLQGLWNASGAEGAYPVTIESSPANAFEVVTPTASGPWTDLTPTLTVSPSERAGAAEAYDPALNATILFGGYSPITDGGLNDTWEFADGHWTELFPPVSPLPRWSGGMVYDAADGYLLLFGGRTPSVPGQLYLNDTWTFNATGWHELFPARAPSPRGRSAMTYDPATDEVVLFGGTTGTITTPGAVFNDTWVFRGGEWTNLTATAGAAPPPTGFASMVYDAADGYALMVGGLSSPELEYYPCSFDRPGEWTFSGTTWSPIVPTGTVPPAGEGMTWYDPATGKAYYYEGLENLSASGGSCESFVGNVYSYSAGAWQLVWAGEAGGSPPPRVAGSVVAGFDPADGLFLLFGGQQTIDGPFFDDTWTFNVTAINPTHPPPWLLPGSSVGPTVTTDTFWLSPGNYTVATELSGYTPVTTTLNVTGPITVSVSLTANASLGIYTPLWAWSNAQIASISTTGSGTTGDPFVLENDQTGPIQAVFGLYNDYGFPVYPGLLLLDTNASVEVRDPPSFLTTTGTTRPAGLPSSNALPLWFWNVSGVALTGGVGLGGAETLVSGLAPFDVIFFDSSGNLIAGNNFTSPIAALLLTFGPTLGPFTGPAGSNTVWGNRFLASPYGYAIMGVVEVESHDLLYNNYFNSTDTACSPGNPSLPNYCWPIYSFTSVSLVDQWNVSVQSAANVRYATGFPAIPLSGSILGTQWQGGNYWRNYGFYPNSYGVLPYTDSVYDELFGVITYITGGGDYAPLVRGTLYTVTFTTSGLPNGNTWEGLVYSNGSLCACDFFPYDLFRTTAHSYSVLLLNGSAQFEILPPTGFNVSPSQGSVNVNGKNLTIPLGFSFVGCKVQFEETGLAPRALARYGWTVVFNGSRRWSTSPLIEFTKVAVGTHPVLVTGPSGYVVTSGVLDVVNVSGPTLVAVTFAKEKTLALTFTEKGLAKDQTWCVRLDNATSCTAKTSQKFVNLTASRLYGQDSYAIVSPLSGQRITAKIGVTAVPINGTLTLVTSTTVAYTFVYDYAVVFTQTGLTSGTWTVTMDKETLGEVVTSPITFEVPNGTYGYKIGPVAGYTSASSPKKATVNGASTSVTVTYTAKKGKSSPTLSPLVPLVLAPTLPGVRAARPRRGCEWVDPC